MEEAHPCTHPSFSPPSFLLLHFPSLSFFPLFHCPSLPLAFSFLSVGSSFFHSFRVSHFPSLPNLVDLVLELDLLPVFWSSCGADSAQTGQMFDLTETWSARLGPVFALILLLLELLGIGWFWSGRRDKLFSPAGRKPSRFWNKRRWVWLLVLLMLLLSPL